MNLYARWALRTEKKRKIQKHNFMSQPHYSGYPKVYVTIYTVLFGLNMFFCADLCRSQRPANSGHRAYVYIYIISFTYIMYQNIHISHTYISYTDRFYIYTYLHIINLHHMYVYIYIHIIHIRSKRAGVESDHIPSTISQLSILIAASASWLPTGP